MSFCVVGSFCSTEFPGFGARTGRGRMEGMFRSLRSSNFVRYGFGWVLGGWGFWCMCLRLPLGRDYRRLGQLLLDWRQVEGKLRILGVFSCGGRRVWVGSRNFQRLCRWGLLYVRVWLMQEISGFARVLGRRDLWNVGLVGF